MKCRLFGFYYDEVKKKCRHDFIIFTFFVAVSLYTRKLRRVELLVCGYMSWKGMLCLFVVIIGAILFLYGANYYDAIVGWAGIFLMLAGVVCELIFKIYEFIVKKEG